MENEEYVFTPVGDQPTQDNLKRNFTKSIALVAVCCSLASWFETSNHQIYFLYAFILISLIVYLMRINSKFIKCIRIDPALGVLYLEYITYKGSEGISTFDLVRSTYKYSYKPSIGAPGYLLIIKDKKSKLEILETKLRNGKDQKNGFFKEQLEQINQLIIGIKNHH